MTGLDARQFRDEIIIPILQRMGMDSPAARVLMLGTAIQESRLIWLRQLGSGPARGVYQIEPATAKDVVGRYFKQKPHIRARVSAALDGLLPPDVRWDENWTAEDERALEFRLTADLAFQTALARVRYWMDPHPLPPAERLEDIGAYYKRVFNTEQGSATVAQFVLNYRDNVPR